MTVSFPYTLAHFANQLELTSVRPELLRFDEQSGSGDGRIWAAQLARPLWQVSGALRPRSAAKAREINAKAAALDGSNKTFVWANPVYAPAAGATTLPGVTVSAIASERGRISLTGLPSGRVVTAGDYLSIGYSGRYYFGAFAETLTANGSGNIANIEIRPYLPLGISAGAVVELGQPKMFAFIPPGGFTPFEETPDGNAVGASIRLLQKP
ncbi:hypothetical protein RGQ15_07170 [Paracoccus sp. MBLB3053]|uniref:Uncharacterized protein n=1 Tax=Paracoccus aurantius TaxID=3073814 RepID=A0ABU2HQM6_9RHOB|nr:hypothetical protein [Paracoccus sp. MBLB3053]MDS9467354.1 hypothetical protein [Paracoccus sp. MBLB3053]